MAKMFRSFSRNCSQYPNAPDDLLEAIYEKLSEERSKQSSSEVLLNWLSSKGKDDDAFAAILARYDEVEVFLKAFPMATTAERRTQLVKRCPEFLSEENISGLPDGDWYPLIQFLHERENLAERLDKLEEYGYHSSWHIQPMEYLLYAAQTNNSALGQYALNCMLTSHIPRSLRNEYGFALLKYKTDTIAETVTFGRDHVVSDISSELRVLTEIIETKEMQSAWPDMEPMPEFARRMIEIFPIPTTTCCPTQQIGPAQKCRHCRVAFNEFAAFVGAASVLREKLAPHLVEGFGLTWPILRDDGSRSLPVNEHTKLGMAALFETLEQRQLVCVGQPIAATEVVIKKEE
jgi:predicted CopG family antitoxin